MTKVLKQNCLRFAHPAEADGRFEVEKTGRLVSRKHPIPEFRKPGTPERRGAKYQWNGIEWNAMERHAMEWNGMLWNGMECLRSCSLIET